MGPSARTIFGILAACGGIFATCAAEPAPPTDAPPFITHAAVGTKSGRSSPPPGIFHEDPRQRIEALRADRGTLDARAIANIRLQRRMHGSGGKRAESSIPGAALAVPVPTWVPLGPTDTHYEQNGVSFLEVDSGRVRRILADPNNADIVYVLSSGGGLWVSHDFQSSPAHWTPLTDHLSTTSGGSVAFGRSSSVLYLGTGDPFDTTVLGGTMTRSLDGGLTWSAEQALPNAISIRDVAVDLTGGSTQASDIVLVATDAGMFRSADGGATYAQVGAATFSGQVIWSIVQTSWGWLASAQPCSPGSGGVFCASAGNLYLSTDQGATWDTIQNHGGTGFTGAGRTSLAVGGSTAQVVYAYAENTTSTDQADLFVSTNGGKDWTALNLAGKTPTNPNVDAPTMDLMQGQAWYNQMVLVDPSISTGNTVYIGGELASAKSDDGGATWTLITDWLPNALCATPPCGIPYAHADMHTATASMAGGQTRIFFGNDGGLAVSSDHGTTWTSSKNTGLGTFLFYSLASTPVLPNAMFGGTQDNGTRVREDATSVFNQSLGGDGIGTGWSQANAYAAIATLPSNTYLTNLGNRSPDLIESWFVQSTPPLVGDAVFLTPLATPAASADTIGTVFFTSSGTQVYRSDDGGVTWSVKGSFVSPTLRANAHAMGVSPADTSHYGVVGAGGTVLYTANDGATWSTATLNTMGIGFQSFGESIAYANNSIIYVSSVSSTPLAAHVVKTIDGGTKWTRADAGIPDVPVNRVVVDLRDATHNTVLAATDAGVYRSTDGGTSWLAYGQGLPNVRVTDIDVPASGSGVRIATYGRGIWALPAVSFVSAALTDDVVSCDHDGLLDNIERGHLTITLRNDGPSSLSAMTAAVTSSNPHITFPQGSVASFPAAAPGATVAASVVVAMNTPTTSPEQANFSISYGDASTGITDVASATFAVNYDEVVAASGNDSQLRTSDWTAGGTLESVPFNLNWRRFASGYLDSRWTQVDSMALTDTMLVSPTITVGPSGLTLQFEQRYSFATGTGTWVDGMVLEGSSDGGASWPDIGANAVPTYDHPLSGATALLTRSAYDGTNAGYPSFVPVTVNLGGVFTAGQQVRLRFRVATNAFGDPGVEVRNIVVTGASNTPFHAVTTNAGVCNPPLVAPTITSPASASFAVGTAGTFTATATGTPAPSFSMPGLPSGLVLNATSGVLSGTPAAGTVGVHPLTLTASSGFLPDASQSFTLTVTKGDQVISFANPGAQSLSTPSVPLVASSSSGLAVTLTSATPAVCTVAGSVATLLTVGTCTIDADQAGDADFNPAPQVQQSFAVAVGDPPRLANISTRMDVLTGNNVMIAGFIIGGSTPKTVAITATGPSLVPFGIANPLVNPTLTLVRQSDHAVIATNDDWQTDVNASQLAASGFAPTNPRESGLYVTLAPGAYTAIVSGAAGGVGVSVIGVFEVDHPEIPLINISTRGYVQTGNNVMIAGLIVQGSGPQTVVITATGPSLVPFGIANPLRNPTLTLVRQSDHAVIGTNDDWQTNANAAQIAASGFAPTDPRESALLVTLSPGAYTAIVQDAGGATGVSVVGAFTVP